MSDRGVTESVVEQATLAWLESSGWTVALLHGPEQIADLPDAGS